jgi:hypothetical protein
LDKNTCDFYSALFDVTRKGTKKKSQELLIVKQNGWVFAIKALAFPVGLCQDCAGQRSRVINQGVFQFKRIEIPPNLPSIAALCFL